jgi:hypothetical protein
MSNSPCQDTSKSTCQRRATEEQRDAILPLISLVPHGKVVYNAWKQARLCHSKASACQFSSWKGKSGTYKKRTMKNPVKFCVTPISVATIPHAMVSVGSQNLGVVLLRIILHGSSNRTYPRKYRVKPVRYWLPVIFRSVVRPSIRAFATAKSQHATNEYCLNRSIPLLRSKNDKRYRIETAGRSLKSSFRSNLFSLMDPETTSISESLVVDAAGGACFSGTEAMVAVMRVLKTKKSEEIHLKYQHDTIPRHARRPAT